MLLKIRTITKQKGQGIVEYALLLAFVVGIAMMLNGADLGGAVKGAFDEVAKVVAGESTAPTDWAHAKKDTFNESNSAERLASDQKALENLAKSFLGKKKSEVKSLIKEHRGANDEPVYLGYFSLNESEGTSFTADQLADNKAGLIYNWMTGDTTTTPNYDSTSKYLVSDYVMNNEYQANAGNQAVGRVGFIVEYTGTNANDTVKSVKVAVDPENRNTVSNGYSSAGLEVLVKKDGDSTKTYYTNTGLTSMDFSVPTN